MSDTIPYAGDPKLYENGEGELTISMHAFTVLYFLAMDAKGLVWLQALAALTSHPDHNGLCFSLELKQFFSPLSCPYQGIFSPLQERKLKLISLAAIH